VRPRPAITTWGSGGSTLVFFHALLPGATGQSIAMTARLLTARLPVRVVGIDAPGFGSAAAAPDDEYDLERLAQRLGDVARAEAGGTFVVAGHSWGAALAVRVAAANPETVRGLVLLDGGHFDHVDLPDYDAGATVDQTLAEMDALDWWHVDHLGPLPDAWRAGLEATPDGRWRSTATPRAAAAAMNALMRGRSSTSYPTIAAAGMPVLLLTATEPEQRRRDNLARTRHISAALPHLTAHALPGAGHDVLRDAPQRVASHIATWWSSYLNT
jgi:pimeloyl-ACP methyl ester carboxylesterase